MKKKWLAALCALALVFTCALGLFGSAFAAARKTIYFTAVNDTILELRDESMPFLANGEVYVPYEVFDPNTTGIKLGIFASYGDNVLVLYDRPNGALVFDLAQDTATSSVGDKYNKRAIRHNSTIFVPVDMVVSYFDLDWAILVDRNYGWVVRIKGGAAQIQDKDFLAQGKHTLESRRNSYLKANGLLDLPVPVPASPTETRQLTYDEIWRMYLEQQSQLAQPSQPVQPSQPAVKPDPDPPPAPSQPAQGTEPPQPRGGDVYVAVRCAPEGDTAALAAALERQEVQGVFFFPADALAGRDDEVRSLAAAGHKIGLLLDGESPEERQAQTERGTELLGHILRAGTDMVLAEGGADLPEGWLAWPAAVDGTAGGRTSARQLEETLEAAVRPEDTFLLLDDGLQTAGLASRLLEELAEEGCTFRLGLEPVLAGRLS